MYAFLIKSTSFSKQICCWKSFPPNWATFLANISGFIRFIHVAQLGHYIGQKIQLKNDADMFPYAQTFTATFVAQRNAVQFGHCHHKLRLGCVRSAVASFRNFLHLSLSLTIYTVARTPSRTFTASSMSTFTASSMSIFTTSSMSRTEPRSCALPIQFSSLKIWPTKQSFLCSMESRSHKSGFIFLRKSSLDVLMVHEMRNTIL